MTNDPKKREKFLREIGLFSLSFSKLEDGISELVAFSIEDVRYWEVRYEEVYGFNLSVKLDLIEKFIKAELPELYKQWQLINIEIKNLNYQRRHLIHGTGNSYLFREPILTLIKKNKKEFDQGSYSIIEIRALTNRIGHVCTGENGIQGVFHTKYKTAAINWHNSRKEPHQRILYKVNNTIQTDWKGE
jgi:hypothetical protein